MNVPPPRDDLNAIDPRSTAALEAEIASKARLARGTVERNHPGESGKAETDTGKAIERQLGIGRAK